MTPLDPTSERGTKSPVPVPPIAVTPTPESALGLRLRIWLGCLGGALISALAFWWVAGTQLTLDADPARLLGWFAGVGGLGLAVGVGLALWLDHGVVTHLRGLTRGLASGRVQELRGLPSASGWGELSELTEWAQVLITRQRLSHRAAAELEQLEVALTQITAGLERWRRTGRWDALPSLPGAGGALGQELNETFARTTELGEQNLEAASRVRDQILGVAGEARDSAGQAERGFVEATALLTTVRELQRLGAELRAGLATPARVPAATAPPAPAAGAREPSFGPAHAERLERYRDGVRSALEELIASSNQSVEQLGGALRRVHEIAAQVQIVSQRATLVALHAVTLESRLPREERRGEELSGELRQLTADVRAAAQHADQLTAEVEHETRAASERMAALRERVAPHFELPIEADEEARAAPAAATPVAPAPPAPTAPAVTALADEAIARLLDRVREMVQDATRKAERLSASGERASRAAERLVRRLEEEAREIDGLMVRLAPAQDSAAAEPVAEAGAADLHLLEGESDASPGEELPEYGATESDPEGIVREERP